MDGFDFQEDRGFRLDPPGHPQGVSCDEFGPSLGPIRLLVKSRAGFVPRPGETLNKLLSNVFGEPLDCSDLLPGLRAMAKALNEGNLPRAMIATQLMRLPVLTEPQAGEPHGPSPFSRPCRMIPNIRAGRRVRRAVAADNSGRRI